MGEMDGGEGYENEWVTRMGGEGVEERVEREWERNPVKHNPCEAESHNHMGDDGAISVTSHVLRGRIVSPMSNFL